MCVFADIVLVNTVSHYVINIPIIMNTIYILYIHKYNIIYLCFP